MPLYSATFAAAGFTLHATRDASKTSCWIKDGRGDVNVDELTGFWSCEFATDGEGWGRYEDELREFFAQGYRHER